MIFRDKIYPAPLESPEVSPYHHLYIYNRVLDFIQKVVMVYCCTGSINSFDSCACFFGRLVLERHIYRTGSTFRMLLQIDDIEGIIEPLQRLANAQRSLGGFSYV